MKAEKYLYTWMSKKYGDSKDVGDWTPEDVVQFAEDFAEQEAIGFLKFDDLGDKNCRHLTYKDYEELYQQYLDQKKDES